MTVSIVILLVVISVQCETIIDCTECNWDSYSEHNDTSRFYFAQDNDGILYISEPNNNKIIRIDWSKGKFSNEEIVVYNSQELVTNFCGGIGGYKDGSCSDAHFEQPKGIVVDSYNNLFVADSNNYIIRKIDTSSKIAI